VDEGFRRAKTTAALLTLAQHRCPCRARRGEPPWPRGRREGRCRAGSHVDLGLHASASVTFRLRFAEAPPLRVSATEGWVDVLIIGIDVPPRALNRGPQGWTGADYHAGLHGTERTALLVKSGTRRSPRSALVARCKVARRRPNAELLGQPWQARRPGLVRLRRRRRARDVRPGDWRRRGRGAGSRQLPLPAREASQMTRRRLFRTAPIRGPSAGVY
jgi:hypothetical protein